MSTSNSPILITGGAVRLGRALALHFARHGHDVALHYHASGPAAAATKQEIEALGVRCALFQQDLTEIAALPGLVAAVLETFPTCRTLINNAAMFERMPFIEASEASFDAHLALNLKAPVFLTQAFARAMQGQGREGACVVNVVDSYITQATHPYFFYLLAKKALAEFTRMAAAELAPHVRVNAVCPGSVIPTPGAANPAPDATPEQVAEAARFLVENAALTGQCLFVDGGKALR